MRNKILIICHTERSPFVPLDASILSAHYSVEILGIERLRKPKLLWLVGTLWTKLIHGDIACVMMWFSVPHLAPVIVAFSKMFGARVVVITGGFDVAYVPGIAWGEMGTWWKRWLQRLTLQRADRVLPFSNFSRRDTLRFSPENRTETLYPGVDIKRYKPSGQKENLVITVCNGIGRFTVIQKGLDIFLQCARALPEYQFLIIGQFNVGDEIGQSFKESAPTNVSFVPRYVSEDELAVFYQRAKVYAQLSAHEGFGVACAEAMACECIAVGTLNTSLPEVIGETGYLVQYGDLLGAVSAIRSAMTSMKNGSEGRKRVETNFSVERRSSRLLEIMDQVIRQ